jgi:sugar phosphate permease
VWLIYATDSPAAHPLVNKEEYKLISTGDDGRSPPDLADSTEAAAQLSTEPKTTDNTRPVWRRLLTNRSLMLLTVSYITIGYFEYLIYYWMQYYFGTVLGLPKDDSRFYSTIPPIAMAIGFPLGGWATDRLRLVWGPRWGRSVVAIVTMVLSAVALVMVPFTRDPVWLVIWFSIALGMTGASDVLFWTVAIELGGRRGGTAAGICNFGGNVGGTVAQWISPWIAGVINNGRLSLPALLLIFGDGWSTALAFGSLLCMAGVVLWFWIDATECLT